MTPPRVRARIVDGMVVEYSEAWVEKGWGHTGCTVTVCGCTANGRKSHKREDGCHPDGAIDRHLVGSTSRPLSNVSRKRLVELGLAEEE